MDQTDKENLQFIMNNSNSYLTVWWETITEEEREYAMHLLDYYSVWILEQKFIETHVEKSIDSELYWTESSEVLRELMSK